MFETMAALMLVGLSAGGNPLRDVKSALRDAQEEVEESDDRCRRKLGEKLDDLLEDLSRAEDSAKKLEDLRDDIKDVVRSANDDCESRLARKVERALEGTDSAITQAIDDVNGKDIAKAVRVGTLGSDPKWAKGQDNLDYYRLWVNKLEIDGYKGRNMRIRMWMKPRNAESWIDWTVWQDSTPGYHSAVWETFELWYPVSKLPGAWERGLNPFSASLRWTVLVEVLDVAASDRDPVASYTFDIEL
jgi:hypothetical protein